MLFMIVNVQDKLLFLLAVARQRGWDAECRITESVGPAPVFVSTLSILVPSVGVLHVWKCFVMLQHALNVRRVYFSLLWILTEWQLRRLIWLSLKTTCSILHRKSSSTLYANVFLDSKYAKYFVSVSLETTSSKYFRGAVTLRAWSAKSAPQAADNVGPLSRPFFRHRSSAWQLTCFGFKTSPFSLCLSSKIVELCAAALTKQNQGRTIGRKNRKPLLNFFCHCTGRFSRPFCFQGEVKHLVRV